MWAASAVMAVLAVTAAAWLRPTVSAASAPPPDPAPAVRAGGSPRTATIEDPLRVDDFRAREDAFRRVEAAVMRAFGPAQAATPPHPRAVSLRVAMGSTPQACLSQAVYYEARGEPAEGQAAVAQVVLNRTRSGRHPADVCGVVFEGAARPGCQFSFACDPRLGGRRPDASAWRRAQTVASAALDGAERPELAGVLNYHADSVRPRWAAQLDRAAVIGRHIFYAAVAAGDRVAAGWRFAPPLPAPAVAAGA